MSKRDKNNLSYGMSLIMILVGLGIIFKFELSWYFFIVLLIFAPLLSSIIIRILPKSNKKKANKIKIQRTSKTNVIPHNRLLGDAEILDLDLKEMSASELERLCYLYYKSKRYNPELTKKGADGGIDLIYYHPKMGKTAVQIKHYIHSNNQITVEKIRELDSAKKNYKCVFSEFITTSTFTSAALVEAPKSMTTYDINWFETKVIPWMYKERIKINKTS